MRSVKLLLTIVILLLPTAAALALVRFALDGDLREYVPAYSTAFNDSVYYWRQILTFSHAGFNGGYYTVDEVPAAAPFSHFYFHGPVFPAFYGTIARFTGWSLASAPIFNLVLVTAAAGFFVYKSKLSSRQLLMLALLMATFWPLPFFLISTMQESVHHAIAIAAAYLFYRLITRRESRRASTMLAVLLIFASLLRPTWSFWFIPVFFLRMESLTGRGVLLALVKAGVLIGGAFAIFAYLSAPYELNFISQLLRTFSNSPGDGLALLGAHIRFNLSLFDQDHPPAILQRYQVLVLLAGALALALLRMAGINRRLTSLWMRIRGRRDEPRKSVQLNASAGENNSLPQKTFSLRELLFHAFNLGGILGLNIAVYDLYASRDFRLMAPHLLMTLLVLIASRRLTVVGVVVASNLALLGGFISTYQEYWTQQFTYNRRDAVLFDAIIDDYVIYDPDAANAWCNTILMEWVPDGDRYTLHPDLMFSTPPGIGISFFFDSAQLQLPLKSRYLLLQGSYTRLADRLNLRFLTQTTQYGESLYLNLDAAC